MALMISDKLAWCSCSVCGVAIGMPAMLMKARREDRKTFYCPNGHTQAFVESKADSLQRALTQAQLERDRALASREVQIKRAEMAERALKRAKKAAGK